MSNRKFMPEGPQFWDSQLIPTVDPHIDSLMRSTAYLINTMHRLEVKFDRVFDAANFEENVAHDVMDKLRLIYKYIKGSSTNDCQTDCSPSVNEMPQNNFMRELVDAVKYSNENIMRVANNFDMVMESGKRSMQSLEKVAETVQDIKERTIRIQQTSSGQFSGGSSHLYRDETASRVNPSVMNTRLNEGSNNYEIAERNKKISTTDQSTQHLITQTNHDSTDRRKTSNDNNNPSGASTSPAYESSAGAIHNWSRNSQANFNNYEEQTGNTDRGHQFGTGTLTNYETKGRDNHNTVTENQNVGHNRSSYEERRKNFKESETFNHNTMPIVSKPIVPEVNSWSSYETFVGESNQSQKIGYNNNDRIGIQQTEHSNASKGNVAFIGNKPPVQSSSRSTFESGNGSGSWNSHTSSNQEIKSDVAQANSYESTVNEIFDQNFVASNKTNNDSGTARQGQNYASKSNVELTENENVSRTSYDSRGSAVIDLNGNPVVTSTKAHYESGKTEERSHFDNRNSYTSSGTKETEVADQETSIVAPSTSNDSISVRKITTTTTTTTAKPQITTTTAKPQESVNTANSERTYRHLRKDAKRVTFEPGKRNCHELTVKRNGIYKFGSLNEVANDGNRFFYERYCDFYTDNRAWTVIQRRFADYNEENFNRSWTDYKHGFGSLDEEFWFGNDFIHRLTFDDDVELRILLEDEDGKTNWVEYSVFKMKSEQDNYKLVISGYSSGSVEDTLIYHNDQEFSTYDHLNGNSQQTSCVSSIGNGWWFKNCSDKDILGNFLGSTSTKMMIRPKK
ncbi:fibrinogen alpha chain-like isoform X2 [Bradysia coprophila]|uniref:fibrinogen alpha chain-like isoform X2 n=1 Tax=Bradysia coprophila TaxID=38358 RepID=UPI00187DC26B|nr:fibrinogen alpha chain-like isoform X2 [Bradysia coprophila]